MSVIVTGHSFEDVLARKLYSGITCLGCIVVDNGIYYIVGTDNTRDVGREAVPVNFNIFRKSPFIVLIEIGLHYGQMLTQIVARPACVVHMCGEGVKLFFGVSRLRSAYFNVSSSCVRLREISSTFKAT